jgi:hypothetical protein
MDNCVRSTVPTNQHVEVVMENSVMFVKWCRVCSAQTTIEVDADKFRRWQQGELIQQVWPDMAVEDREMLISGTHPECWSWLFGDEDEETGCEFE